MQRNPQSVCLLQCDGVPLNLSDGPTLQGIALLNIPSTHGGTNMWGDSKARRIKKKRKKKRKKESNSVNSVSSITDIDLSSAVQGEERVSGLIRDIDLDRHHPTICDMLLYFLRVYWI